MPHLDVFQPMVPQPTVSQLIPHKDFLDTSSQLVDASTYPPVPEIIENFEEDPEKAMKYITWEHRDKLTEGRMVPARGTLQSTFIFPLEQWSKKYANIVEKGRQTLTKSKEFGLNHEDNQIFIRIREKAQGLKNMLAQICEYKKHTDLDFERLTRNKRVIGAIIFLIFTTIAVVGVSAAVAASTRVVTKEDLVLEQDISREAQELERIEIRRAEKDAKRIDSLEEKIDTLEHNHAIESFGRYLEHTAEVAFKELHLIFDPNSYNFLPSNILERMALDIRSYFASKSDDLFEHVQGNGITEILYLSYFEKKVLQEKGSNECEKAFVVLVATTVDPILDVVGTPTNIPQQYRTDQGNYFYINDKLIMAPSRFRPANALAAQRLVMTSSSITVTVLNNTVFMVHNTGLRLSVNITCPGNISQEILYPETPMLSLNTSCSLVSQHLNISKYDQEYFEDTIAENYNLYDTETAGSDYYIGYHEKKISNTHDIAEMYAKADDIFRKRSSITQHRMAKLDEDWGPSKWMKAAGDYLAGWFNDGLHVVLAAVCVIVMFMLLNIVVKCVRKRR